MADAKDGWFVRDGEGRVFGPVPLAELVGWARESRVEPTYAVSRDRENWMAAPLVAELGMTWLVETAPGTFFGPFNRAVVDGLLSAGTLAKDARLYELDTGRAAAERAQFEAEKARLGTELAAKTQALADLEARAAKQAETTKKTMAFMEAKLAELSGAQQSASSAADAELAAAREEIYAQRERAERAEARANDAEARVAKAEAAIAKCEAECAAGANRLSVAETEIADLRAQLETVTKFTSARPAPKAEVVQPEVVISDAPPPKSAPRFPGMGSSAGLAALEAAARRELAAAKKQGLGLGGLFGKK